MGTVTPQTALIEPEFPIKILCVAEQVLVCIKGWPRLRAWPSSWRRVMSANSDVLVENPAKDRPFARLAISLVSRFTVT